jgi:hypothetical protein
MDPVFTLPWPEFHLAERLRAKFPKIAGYSIMIPLSRQEKGIDLAILKQHPTGSRVATFQVKASRTWISEESQIARRGQTHRRVFRFTMRFNNFALPEEADFFLLSGMYAPDPFRTLRVNARWYRDCTLLFTKMEMREFLADCRTRRGRPDCMFYFGFDNPDAVFQTRGVQNGSQKDHSEFVLDQRINLIKEVLD